MERITGLEVRLAELFAEQVSVLPVLQVDDHVTPEGIDLVDEPAPRRTSSTAARRLVAAARIAARFPLLRADVAGGEIDHRRVDVVVRERVRRVVAGRRVGFAALAKGTSRPGADPDPSAGHPGEPSSGAPAPGPGAGDARGAGAKRFDAVVERLMAPVWGAPGTATGTGPQITIARPAATGLDDQPARPAGNGVVPAELVRHLPRDRGFRRVASDPVSGDAVGADGHVHPPGPSPTSTPPRPAGLRPPASSSPPRVRSRPPGSCPRTTWSPTPPRSPHPS